MKTPFVVFKKRQFDVTFRMRDNWLVDVVERKAGKIVHEAQIILSDVDNFIHYYERDKFTYLRRTK